MQPLLHASTMPRLGAPRAACPRSLGGNSAALARLLLALLILLRSSNAMASPAVAQRFSPDVESYVSPDRVTVLGPASQLDAAGLVCHTLQQVALEARERRGSVQLNLFETFEELAFYASSKLRILLAEIGSR